MIAILMAVALVQDLPKEDEAQKELREAWTKIVALCHEEKKDDVAKLIAAMEFTREDLVALFGEEKTAKAYESYQKSWKDVLQEAPADLIKRAKEGKWEEVQVIEITGVRDEKELSGQDKSVLAALVDKEAKVYNIRIKAKGESDGFLLRCFVKTKNGWKMGLKIGRALGDK